MASSILRILLISLTALALLLPLCNSQCFSENDNGNFMDKTSLKQLYQGQLKFTLKMFNIINKERSGSNIFFSPYSVYHALLLAYFASANQTEKALKESLMFDKDQTKVNILNSYIFESLQRQYHNQGVSYEFNSVDKLFADTHLRVRDCFLTKFNKEVALLNFRENPAECRDFINAWVANTTKNHIKDLIPADGITARTNLVLANAAYFKGVWKSRFPVESTTKKVFHISSRDRTPVMMMKQKGTFHYTLSEELGANILELPYKGEDISMFIVLPPFAVDDGIGDVISKLTPERLEEIVEDGQLMAREVIVEIPRFTVEETIPLKSILQTMGVGDLFEATSDFSTLTMDQVIFDDAIHKAQIKVDEDGTVATAATALFGFRSSRPLEPARFIADHAFVYLLYDRSSQSVLFMGVYRDPKK